MHKPVDKCDEQRKGKGKAEEAEKKEPRDWDQQRDQEGSSWHYFCWVCPAAQCGLTGKLT